MYVCMQQMNKARYDDTCELEATTLGFDIDGPSHV